METNMTEDSPVDTVNRSKNRRKLVLLFAVAFVPMIIAYGMFFYVPALIPATTTNEGQLIQPSLPVTVLQTNETLDIPLGVWTVLIPVAEHCDDHCQQRLYLSRQIKIGFGKDADRLQRVALLETDPDAAYDTLVAAEHSDLLSHVYNAKALQAALNAALPAPMSITDGILLMDPNGNIMMLYSFDKIGAPMRKDIKHLLKISNIG
jgi:cytochrome oxidase Cu insertion factor (SCO1/SenC/PrrC family)